jgi:uncharacterized protein YbaP (TraB family)
MKNIIIAIILLIAAQVSLGQKTILWKVTDTINNKTSFIVGTFHQFGNSFVDSIPELKKRLYESEIAIFESIDKIENTIKMIEKREASLEIEKRLKKKDLIKLKEIAKEWNVDLYKLKPIEIRWKLQQEFQKTKCKTTRPTDRFDHFDNYLQYLAEKNNIKILGLETDSLQLSLIEKENKYPNWKKERKNISPWIEQMTTDNPNMNNCSLAIKYRKFDLNYEFEKECETNVLLKERNENWMEILPKMLSEKDCFIAVGLFHLYYECGILQQLKSKGFKIELIEIKPVTNN